MRYGPVVVSDRSAAVPGDRLAGRLAMRGVCFTYPRRPDDKTTDETDPVTNDMVIAILRDEEGHRRLFEGYLREYEAEGKA